MTNGDRTIAVYWDFENVVLSQFDFTHGPRAWRLVNTGGPPDDDLDEMLATAHVDVAAVVDYVATIGPVSIHRAYGDWSRRWLNRYDRDVLKHSVDLVQMFPARGTKNGADIRMAIDAVRDLQSYPHITDVVIVAGDSDFISLAQHCRREGRRVTGVGVRRSVSPALISACDVFKYIDTLSAKKGSARTRTTHVKREIQIPIGMQRLVRDAIVQLAGQTTDGWVRRVQIKPLLLRLDPAFDEADTGARTFTEFLAAMAEMLESRSADADREYRLTDSSVRPVVPTSTDASPSTEAKPPDADLEQIARNALRTILTAAGVVGRTLHAPQVHSALQVALPDFDFRPLGHATLSAFIEAQPDVAILERHEDGYAVCRIADGAAASISERFELALRTCPTRISDIVAGHLRGTDPLAAAYAATLRLATINLPTDKQLMWRLIPLLPTLIIDPEELSSRGQVAALLEAVLAGSESVSAPESDATATLPEPERRRLFSALGGLTTSSGLLQTLQASTPAEITRVSPETTVQMIAALLARLVIRAIHKEGFPDIEDEAFVYAMAGEEPPKGAREALLSALQQARTVHPSPTG